MTATILEMIKEDGGFTLHRAGKPMLTPQRHAVLLPTQALAEVMVSEWQTGKSFSPRTMPITALSFTALDVVAPHRNRVAQSMLAFADTDLLLYRSETTGLRKRQDAGWDPVLQWASERYGSAANVTTGVMPMDQPKALLTALGKAVNTYDDFRLSAFSVMTQSLGSIFLGLALIEGELNPENAFGLSRIDEEWQAEHWGEDSLALARAREISRDVKEASRFAQLATG